MHPERGHGADMMVVACVSSLVKGLDPTGVLGSENMVSPAFATVGQMAADELLDPELPRRHVPSQSGQVTTRHAATACTARPQPTNTDRRRCICTRRTGMRSVNTAKTINPRHKSTQNSQALPASALFPLKLTCIPFNGKRQIRSDPSRSRLPLQCRSMIPSPGSEGRRVRLHTCTLH